MKQPKPILKNKEVRAIIDYRQLNGLKEKDIIFIENLIIKKIRDKLIPKIKKRISLDVFPILKHKIGDTQKLGKLYLQNN